jgi:hypothetical protein
MGGSFEQRLISELISSGFSMSPSASATLRRRFNSCSVQLLLNEATVILWVLKWLKMLFIFLV